MRNRLLISTRRMQNRHLRCLPGTRRLVCQSCGVQHLNFGFGTQIYENSSGTRGSTSVTGSVVGTVMENITYGEVVTVTCDADHRLQGQNCSKRTFSVKCGEDGAFSYTGDFNSLTRCEPVSCPVNLIDSSNGQLNTSQSTVVKGQVATLTCNTGFHVKGSVAGYTGDYPLPSHPRVHPNQCQDDCTFTSPVPTCEKRGCAAITAAASWTKTTDDAVTLQLPIQEESMKEGDTVDVQCPQGYLVDDDSVEPASTISNQTTSICTCNDTAVPAICELSPVNCSRRSCVPHFTVT